MLPQWANHHDPELKGQIINSGVLGYLLWLLSPREKKRKESFLALCFTRQIRKAWTCLLEIRARMSKKSFSDEKGKLTSLRCPSTTRKETLTCSDNWSTLRWSRVVWYCVVLYLSHPSGLTQFQERSHLIDTQGITLVTNGSNVILFCVFILCFGTYFFN